MKSNKIDLIVHPVRLRIITALSGRKLTPQEIGMMLPDVAQATLYRHIKALVDGDILIITEETQIRGTVEKRYALHDESVSHLTKEELAALSKEEHTRYFIQYLMSILGDFTGYLEGNEDIALEQDGVGYSRANLRLTEEEFAQFTVELRELVMRYVDLEREGKSRIINIVLLPGADDD